MITDPWFYAVAVPAVLMMGLSKSGFLGGFGALSTPLLATTISVPQAASIMLPLLLVMDMVGLQQLWKERDRDLLRLLMPAGLIGVLIGALLFGVFSTRAVALVVGVLTLLFLAQRLLFPPRKEGRPPPRWVGRVLAVMSGFTSFVAHAGSPPINAYVLPLKLNPVPYTATMAVFFAAVNLAKWIPYALLGLIDRTNLTTSLVLIPLAPLGVWLGVQMTRRIDSTWFYRFAYAGMFLAGTKLVYDGLK